MARMYSRKKGKSGSKKVYTSSANTWIRYKPKEVELLIVKLAKEGHSASMIGIILRDSYGIPSVKQVLGKKIQEVLKEKGLLKKLPEDLTNLMRRALQIRAHLEKHHKDMTAKRGLEITESKILRLVKYYKKTGKVDKSWNYNPAEASLYIE